MSEYVKIYHATTRIYQSSLNHNELNHSTVCSILHVLPIGKKFFKYIGVSALKSSLNHRCYTLEWGNVRGAKVGSINLLDLFILILNDKLWRARRKKKKKREMGPFFYTNRKVIIHHRKRKRERWRAGTELSGN